MRKFWIGAVFTLLVTASAVADIINFNFTTGLPGSVTATMAGGLMSGPSMLTSISDSTTSVNIPTPGNYVNGNTGPASLLTQVGLIITGSFTAGGSVLVKDSMGNVLVSGVTEDGGALVAASGGTGTFFSLFHVTSVSSSALALFGLGPAFLPDGSVAFTTGDSVFNGTTFTANIGGGAVSIQTPIPEPASLGLLGIGFLTVAGGLWKRTHRSPR